MTTSAIEMAQIKRKRIIDAGGTIEIENNLIRKSLADPKSRKKAIDAFCFECFGGTKDSLPDPGWKNMISECTAPNCPLYRFRPYRKKEKP